MATRDINSINRNTLDQAVSNTGNKRRSNSALQDVNKVQAEKEAKLLYDIQLKYVKRGWKDKKKIEEQAQKDLLKIEEGNIKKSLKERLQAAKEEREQRIKDLEEEYRLATSNEEKKAAKQKLNAEKAKEYSIEAAKQVASAATQAAFRAADNAVKAGLSVYQDYMSGIEARIQGTGSSFQGMLKNIRGNLAVSPYVSQISVIQNLNKLISQGIAYNVEQRAFLETISDKIATTFDATNGTLLRLIRIQQADTTAARLGLEANLTRYLNSTYKDTSYLSDQFDTVSQSLYEATSLAGRNMGVELEYVVQKWLGSLYSVGASDQLISNLAQGIGYLGSGNISALGSNEGLMNLFTMAASRVGTDISSILTGGLNPTEANKLLSGVVSYIQEIGRTENVAIRSQYANMFGMTISDMTALLNLSSKDLVDISKNMLTYSDTINEVSYQLNQVSKRTHVSELIDNVLSNAALTMGLNIAGNAATYSIYKLGEVIDTLTGGLKVPTISVLGSGIDLGITYGQLVQTPVLGFGAVSTLFDAISSIQNRGGLNLGAWGASDYNARGTGLTTTTYGSTVGISSSAVIGGGSSSSVSQSLSDVQAEAKSVQGEAPSESAKLDENIITIVDTLRSIYDILRDVSTGTSSFKVDSLYNGSVV